MGETLFAVGVSGRMHALDKSGGRVQWQALDFKNSYSSPTLATIAGEEQLIVFMAEELIGVDPDDGRLSWRFPDGGTGQSVASLRSWKAIAASLR